jgi:long-chain acyl-CoA synthetase
MSPRVPAQGPPSGARPSTVAALIERRFEATPSALAWWLPAPPGEGGGPPRSADLPGPAWAAVGWADIDRASAAAALADTPADARVGLLADTTGAWAATAFGVWRAGRTLVPLHTTSSDEDLRYVIADAGVSVVFADEGGARRLAALGLSTPTFPLVDPIRAPSAVRHSLRPARVDPAAPAALVYTSGTTGRPKGVILTHANLVAVTLGAAELLPREPDDLVYHFLPFSHVYGLVNLVVSAWAGAPMAIDGRIDRLQDGLQQVRPTYVAAVPRVFERILATARARASARGARAEQTFARAEQVAAAWSRARHAGGPSLGLRLARAAFDRLIYRRVRAALGGRMRAMSSGGAPLPPSLLHTFSGMGIDVLEGYGMTELCSITAANRPDAWRPGSVGLPGPGIEVRIAADGEVLVRGPTVMAGYWGQPDATAHAITDGWMHTGDIGSLDADGYLYITDRKKDLLITSGGRNVAPAPIEHALRAACPLLSAAVVIGDRRPWLVALFTLDAELLHAWADARRLGPGEARLEAARAEIAAAVDAVNARLARHEHIRAWAMLDEELSIAAGELTPSLKVRRTVVLQRRAKIIDSLYGVPE